MNKDYPLPEELYQGLILLKNYYRQTLNQGWSGCAGEEESAMIEFAELITSHISLIEAFIENRIKENND